MAHIELQAVSFTYPNSGQETLHEVSLNVERGEFVVLCGASGSGKTTLLRLLKPSLAPVGQYAGEIRLSGTPLSALSRREEASRIGFVQQNPDAQLVTDKVWHELAFGLESLGADSTEIRRKTAEMASFFGIEDWFYRDVSSLSGGQKQTLNLAGVMTMQPEVLLLDEPTSQLDPIAARDFLSALSQLNRELGVTVLLCEHRLEEVLGYADRVAVLEAGRLLCADTPIRVGELLRERKSPLFRAMPTPMRVWAAIRDAKAAGDCPVTVREGRAWLERFAARHPLYPLPVHQEKRHTDKPTVCLKDIWFRYEKNAPDVLRGLRLEAWAGEVTAILGGNGAGKSTTLLTAAGLQKPWRGHVEICGKAPEIMRGLPENGLVMLPQNPAALFTHNTVWEELEEYVEAAPEATERLRQTARLCRIEHLLSRHPYDLSGGEQQCAALACVLLRRPQVLFLDEPTKGLDAGFQAEVAEILRTLARNGVTVVLISHDVAFCAAVADRCALLFDGQITAEGTPHTFFAGLSFYTTAANRMARAIEPQVVTAEDALILCGGQPDSLPVSSPTDNGNMPESGSTSVPDVQTAKKRPRRKLSRRSKLLLALMLVLMPLTIWAGIRFFGDRKYYLISLLLIAEAILPSLVLFEGRKPSAREIVLLAVLCAVGIVGRAAFFMVPSFKPVLAVVIVTGVAFDGETGFLVGAVTALVSNFFFGQGPWTPWQMFAFGLCGLLAGFAYERGILSGKRLSLAIFGAAEAFIIYGGLLNPASVLMFQNHPTWQMIFTAYLTGLPSDAVHAAATFCFLWLFSKPFLEKLERVKTKWGLLL